MKSPKKEVSIPKKYSLMFLLSFILLAAGGKAFSQTSSGQPKSLRDTFRNLVTYISRTVRYPKEARENNIMGNVIVQFNLDTNRKITNIIVLKGIGGDDSYGCDEEVVRTLKSYRQPVDALPGAYKLMATFYLGDKEPTNTSPVGIRKDPLLIGDVVITGYVKRSN
jgi:TonB family protein